MKHPSPLLVLAFTLTYLSCSFADDPLVEAANRAERELKNDAAESQQKEASSVDDLNSSSSDFHVSDFADGYSKGAHHNHDHHHVAGHKGSKGFNDDLSYHKNRHGNHGHSKDIGFYDNGGEHYKGNEYKKQFHGDHFKGQKGSKGHNLGSKGHVNKGHQNKGFKNVYHKEEYGVNKKYYDDADFQKHFNDHDGFDSYFGSQKGDSIKGGQYFGGNKHGSFGQKGSSEKGHHYNSLGGHKGNFGNTKYHSHDSAYGKNGGHLHKGIGGYHGGFGGHHGGFVGHHGGIGGHHGDHSGHYGHLGGYKIPHHGVFIGNGGGYRHGSGLHGHKIGYGHGGHGKGLASGHSNFNLRNHY